ncbi:MAG: hypothetical protein KAS07_03215 [Candidatus Pacebacteria bacterium]|nr:hypothetical protein [Candidatus Paceibacterota bacterium]
MNIRLNKTISTKFAFLVIIAMTVFAIGFVARKTFKVIDEMEKNTLQIQRREDQLLEKMKLR